MCSKSGAVCPIIGVCLFLLVIGIGISSVIVSAFVNRCHIQAKIIKAQSDLIGILKSQIGDYTNLPDDAIYSSDGKIAAIFDGNIINDANSHVISGNIIVCDVRHRTVVRILRKQSGVPMCFSPDNNFLLVGYNVYDWRKQELVKTFNFRGTPMSGVWKGYSIVIEGEGEGSDSKNRSLVHKTFHFYPPAKPRPQKPSSPPTRQGIALRTAITQFGRWRFSIYRPNNTIKISGKFQNSKNIS